VTTSALMPLIGGAEVRQDPATGSVAVVLKLACGPMSVEFLISPGGATGFGTGLADALAQADSAAEAMVPGLTVPPTGLILPQNGRRVAP